MAQRSGCQNTQQALLSASKYNLGPITTELLYILNISHVEESTGAFVDTAAKLLDCVCGLATVGLSPNVKVSQKHFSESKNSKIHPCLWNCGLGELPCSFRYITQR